MFRHHKREQTTWVTTLASCVHAASVSFSDQLGFVLSTIPSMSLYVSGNRSIGTATYGVSIVWNVL